MAGRASRATISARGGTTGRAAGWPTKFGFAGGRSGPPPAIVPVPAVCAAGGGAAAPGVGRAIGRVGIGMFGTAALGRGAPGVVIIAGGTEAGVAGALTGALIAGAGFGVSDTAGGIGWRGPDRICPGLGGGGAERDGITGPRFAGAPGCPVANGGRNGNAGRTGAATGASVVSAGADTAGLGASGATGALFATTGAGSVAGVSISRTGSCRGAGS